jgi:alkyldihydroxyacetonephosphate synthase
VKKIAQTNIPVSMLRLSDASETEITLVLSRKDRLVSWASRGLRLLGFGADRCLLIYAVTGDHKSVRFAMDQISKIIRSRGGLLAGSIIGDQWQKSRFLSPYLRNTLWDNGYAVDTLETAIPWNKISHLAGALKVSIMEQAEKNGIKTLVFAHLSHIYHDGASIYITFILPRTQAGYDLLQIWKSIKNAASQTIISQGGTISHQHGIGQDHLPFLEAEKGEIGMDILQSIQDICDPNAILNPHVLFSNGHRPRID